MPLTSPFSKLHFRVMDTEELARKAKDGRKIKDERPGECLIID